jgi:hypothetical protein
LHVRDPALHYGVATNLFNPQSEIRNQSMKPLSLIAALLLATPALADHLRVDVGQQNDRKDAFQRDWDQWQIASGEEASQNFDGVRITLRSAGKGGLRADFNKKYLVGGAAIAADGVVGLSAGPHSLVTYHNTISGPQSKPYKLTVKGSSATAATVTPSHQVLDNEDLGAGYLEFTAVAGEPVVVQISADDGADVILNGFEIDGADPNRKARRPSPASSDWHVDADAGMLDLRWSPAPGAAKHHVVLYSAPSLEGAVAAARGEKVIGGQSWSEVEVSSEGDSASVSALVDPNRSNLHYAWRVDSIDADGKVTKGDVWTFRPRHLAFPGAEGYGRFAIGGRGGKVVKVTNLNDSGPGSLRAAVQLNEPRTVVFDVSGKIVLESTLGLRNPYLTIAGQTAPGLGICIANYNMGALGCHDLIVRDMRVRPGNTSGDTLDGMGMASTDHAIYDHCSISWTQDESFSSRGAHNITLQRTLISEALNIAGHRNYEAGKQHGFAASISGDIGSFHHNLLAHCSGRNWSLAGGLDQATRHAGRLDIRNNVVFNWGHRTTDGGAKQVVFVNNFYKPGPATRVFHVLKAEREAVNAFGPQMYYVEGNVLEGKFDGKDRMGGVIQEDGPDEPWIVDEPFFPSYVETQTAAEAYEDVLADVGCNVPALDPHDTRILEEVHTGQPKYKGSKSGLPGLPDTPDDVGGWDEYPEIHRPADWDQDNDGMPSKWEAAEGLNPDDPADGNLDKDGDGYTNLEEYLNDLADKKL